MFRVPPVIAEDQPYQQQPIRDYRMSRPDYREAPRTGAVKDDTGGEFKRCRGAILIRAMIFPCNNDSRQSQIRVFLIFLSSATGKLSRIAPRTSSL
jgi:hypothetical protein